jgi:SNF2 family DNA or RNA helicase
VRNELIILTNHIHRSLFCIVDGVKFLWSQVFESTAQIAAGIDRDTQIDSGGSGAILAHCMGLGKTFTTIVFLQTLFQYSKLTHIHRVLILCPLNTAIKYNEYLFISRTKFNLFLFLNSIVVGKMSFIIGYTNLKQK